MREPVVQDCDSTFQQRIAKWMLACFGDTIARDVVERNYRFLEEALELVQACGCPRDQALRLVEYVYARPAGDIGQEIGGVMVTLATLCSAQARDLNDEAERELARVWTAIDKIRAKQASKYERGVGVNNPLP